MPKRSFNCKHSGMKKYLILTAAALAALVSCSKVRTDFEGPERAITFQMASLATSTKADDKPADYKEAYQAIPFGAYAWFKGVNAADNSTFMTNQKVSYVKADNVWLPEGSTYYWPKSGSLDFICYSPYSAEAKGMTIAEDKISFSGYTVGTDDLMYGDKATGLTQNVDSWYYNGVPVLFRHALARVNFKVAAAYLEKTADTGDKMKWEVDVTAVSVKDVRTTGSLELPHDGKAWKLPESKVWTPTDAKKDLVFDVKSLKTLTLEPQSLGEGQLVLPQLLAQGPQVEMVLTIKTYHDIGNGYQLILTEKDVKVAAALVLDKLPQWGINQDITYTFVIAPTRSNGDGGDPNKPVDPKNPDLSDAEILFDPAVVDWQLVDVNATINL